MFSFPVYRELFPPVLFQRLFDGYNVALVCLSFSDILVELILDSLHHTQAELWSARGKILFSLWAWHGKNELHFTCRQFTAEQNKTQRPVRLLIICWLPRLANRWNFEHPWHDWKNSWYACQCATYGWWSIHLMSLNFMRSEETTFGGI